MQLWAVFPRKRCREYIRYCDVIKTAKIHSYEVVLVTVDDGFIVIVT